MQTDWTDVMTPGISFDSLAEQIVTHFMRSERFQGFSEAIVIRIALKRDERKAYDVIAPVSHFFEIRQVGCFSTHRTSKEMKEAFGQDFAHELRSELNNMFYSSPPTFAFSPMADGLKHDVIYKLWPNVDDTATIILADDPNASLIDYLSPEDDNNLSEVANDFKKVALSFRVVS